MVLMLLAAEQPQVAVSAPQPLEQRCKVGNAVVHQHGTAFRNGNIFTLPPAAVGMNGKPAITGRERLLIIRSLQPRDRMVLRSSSRGTHGVPLLRIPAILPANRGFPQKSTASFMKRPPSRMTIGDLTSSSAMPVILFPNNSVSGSPHGFLQASFQQAWASPHV